MLKLIKNFVRGGFKEIWEIKNSPSKKDEKIKDKDLLLIQKTIVAFLEKHNNFFIKEWPKYINNELNNLFINRQTPVNAREYVNVQFNIWLKRYIFAKEQSIKKKHIKKIRKIWICSDLILDLNVFLDMYGFTTTFI